VEELHSIGCVHNDLKLDNICVGYPNAGDELDQLKLIDFGIASSYANIKSLFREPKKDDEHIEMESQRFKGNYAFCSPNALRNKSTSRRDDLLSLLYILIFLLTLKVPFMEENINLPEKEALYRK
jgi:casein kinase I homolog HRR25